MYSSIDIIFNPNSTGPSRRYAEKLKAELLEFDPKLTIHLHATKYAGHAQELAYLAARSTKSPLIISSSGDGGYNEVINGAMKAQLEGARPVCAVLAAGNANDHSRTLTKQPLIELIKHKKEKKIDLLKLTIRTSTTTQIYYAHSYIGFGLTPIVATELNKTNLNAFNELWIVLKTFYKYRPFKIKHGFKVMTLDSIIFANIGEMAKVLTMSKSSKPDDGLFEVVPFLHAHKIRLLRKLAKATLSSLQPSRQYKNYTFKVLKKMPAQLDGEVKVIPDKTDIRISCERKMLTTLLG